MQTYKITLRTDDWFPTSEWLPLIAKVDDSLDIHNDSDDYDFVETKVREYFINRYFYDFEVNSPEIDFEYLEDGVPDFIVTPMGIYELFHEDSQVSS